MYFYVSYIYSDSFVYDALALSSVIVRTNFDGLDDCISLDCNVIYLVLLDFSCSDTSVK